MNYFTRLCAILTLVISTQAFSATFSVPNYFEVLYVDREKVSMFGEEQTVELEPGAHEIILRYDQVIERFSEEETFRSEPIILDLNILEADQLKLSAIEPKKVSEAKKFLKTLEFEIVDQHDEVADYKSHVLPLKPGLQWTRNYLKEAIAFKESQKLAVLETKLKKYEKTEKISDASQTQLNTLKNSYKKADHGSKIAFRFWVIDPTFIAKKETDSLTTLKSLYLKTTPQIQRELQIWMIK